MFRYFTFEKIEAFSTSEKSDIENYVITYKTYLISSTDRRIALRADSIISGLNCPKNPQLKGQ